MKPSQLKRHLLKQVENKSTCLVTGSPGIGKTHIVKSVREAFEDKHNSPCDLILSHPSIKDPSDYRGLGGIVNGQAEFLAFGDVRKLINATVPTICFLDDFGTASPAVQAAVMQLLEGGELDGKKISEHVVFFGATNRAKDRAGVSGLLTPVLRRFKTIIQLDVDLDEWIQWAFLHKMPSELIAFNRFRPNFLTDPFTPSREVANFPCPSTIASVGEQQNKGIDSDLEFEVFQGAAGEAFALEYTQFLKLSRDLPTVEDILKDPRKINIPKKADELYAICGALAYAMNLSNIDKARLFIDRLEPEFSVMTIQDAIGMKPELISSSHTDKVIEKNLDLITA